MVRGPTGSFNQAGHFANFKTVCKLSDLSRGRRVFGDESDIILLSEISKRRNSRNVRKTNFVIIVIMNYE